MPVSTPRIALITVLVVLVASAVLPLVVTMLLQISGWQPRWLEMPIGRSCGQYLSSDHRYGLVCSRSFGRIQLYDVRRGQSSGHSFLAEDMDALEEPTPRRELIAQSRDGTRVSLGVSLPHLFGDDGGPDIDIGWERAELMENPFEVRLRMLGTSDPWVRFEKRGWIARLSEPVLGMVAFIALVALTWIDRRKRKAGRC